MADHTSPFSAAYQTGAGSTSKRRHGGIAVDGPPAGPTLWRQTRVVLAAARLDSDPASNRLKNSALDRVGGRGERQDEGERRIEQGESAIAFVPARRAFVLGVDQQSDAADILSDAEPAIGGRRASAWPAGESRGDFSRNPSEPLGAPQGPAS